MDKLKHIHIGLFFITAIILFSGCIEQINEIFGGTTVTTTIPGGAVSNITDVSEVLMDDFLETESAKGAVVYIYPEKLGEGDTVKSQAMNETTEYAIEKPVWFVYIDDEPREFFPHSVRYVFIDTESGEINMVRESWRPLVNGEPINDAIDAGGGGLTVYSI